MDNSLLVGTIIEFIAVKKRQVDDITFWLNKTGQELLGVIEENGLWIIYAKKVKGGFFEDKIE